jgi:hypothetical protein
MVDLEELSLLFLHYSNIIKIIQNEEWYITIPGWDFITWGFPELQERTFNPDARGSFDLFGKQIKLLHQNLTVFLHIIAMRFHLEKHLMLYQ